MSDFQIRKIILPSGKAVEIVYVSNPETHADDETSGRRLEACPCCASELVFPLDWSESDEGGWYLELRCPECEWRGDGHFSQGDVEAYDRALARGSDAIISTLERLGRERMREDIERFVDALENDHILPCDF